VTVAFLRTLYALPAPASLPAATSATTSGRADSATQGVFETNNEHFSPSDLRTFETLFSLPPASVAVAGGYTSNACSLDPSGASGGDACFEGNLDVQVCE
jgi:hypothetical protein